MSQQDVAPSRVSYGSALARSGTTPRSRRATQSTASRNIARSSVYNLRAGPRASYRADAVRQKGRHRDGPESCGNSVFESEATQCSADSVLRRCKPKALIGSPWSWWMRDHVTQAVQGAAMAPAQMFQDVNSMTEQTYKDIHEGEYDVTNFYHREGIVQAIARSSYFGTLTILLISLNTVWIGIEIDLNTKSNLNDAEWYFQAGEYFFCVFFLFEWSTRFFAFERKRNCCRDRWFLFDSFLVLIMLIETFVLPHVLDRAEEDDSSPGTSTSPLPSASSGGDDGGSDVGQLAVLRMLRLLRLTRMVRFMRTMPELVTLVRSLSIAARPVLSTLGLLFILIYMFGIVFRSQLDARGYPYVEHKFGRLASSMGTLLLTGTLLDVVTKVADPLLEVDPLLTMVFVAFILLSSFTVLNLLIGMLCEVVNVVAAAEKEKAMVNYVKSALTHVLEELDEDGSGMISKGEFDRLVKIPTAVQALEDLGVDVQNLVSLSDHIFASNDGFDGAPGSGSHPAKKRESHAAPKVEDEFSQVQTYADGYGSQCSSWASGGSTPSGDAGGAALEDLGERPSLDSAPERSAASGRRRRPSPFDGEEPRRGAEQDLPRILHDAVEVGGAEVESRSSESTADDVGRELSFGDFIEMVIRLRSENRPSVLDVVDLRRLCLQSQHQTLERLDRVEELNTEVAEDVRQLICNHPMYRLVIDHPLLRERTRASSSTAGQDNLPFQPTSSETAYSSPALAPCKNALARAFAMADAIGTPSGARSADAGAAEEEEEGLLRSSPPRRSLGQEVTARSHGSTRSLVPTSRVVTPSTPSSSSGVALAKTGPVLRRRRQAASAGGAAASSRAAEVWVSGSGCGGGGSARADAPDEAALARAFATANMGLNEREEGDEDRARRHAGRRRPDEVVLNRILDLAAKEGEDESAAI